MRKRITFLGLCFTLFALLIISSIVLAQGNGFSETFDGSELAGWDRTPGVTVSNGLLNIPPENFTVFPGTWGRNYVRDVDSSFGRRRFYSELRGK